MLDSQLANQRNKVEELKEKTAFNATKQLLDKYSQVRGATDDIDDSSVRQRKTGSGNSISHRDVSEPSMNNGGTFGKHGYHLKQSFGSIFIDKLFLSLCHIIRTDCNLVHDD